MTALLDLDPPAGEPLSLLASPLPCPAALGDARVERLEFSCRGDRVPCALVVPPGEGPFPLALVQLDRAGEVEDDLATALGSAAEWVGAGCALASIELPLQGERASAKLSELFAEATQRARQGEALDETSSNLWLELTRQATMELRRTLDLVAALPTVDASRIGYAGFGLGAFVGALVCALDPRPSAIVLADCGARIAPEPIAPESFVGRIAPRPLCFVNAESADVSDAVGRAAAEKLHGAAGEPKQVIWHARPRSALDAAWAFLSQSLG